MVSGRDTRTPYARFVLLSWPELTTVVARCSDRASAAKLQRHLLEVHGRDTFLGELVDERAGR